MDGNRREEATCVGKRGLHVTIVQFPVMERDGKFTVFTMERNDYFNWRDFIGKRTGW